MGGFIVRVLMMDREFECVKEEIGLVEANTTAAHKHVGDIERYIRVVKERACYVKRDMPEDIVYLHKYIVIWMVYFCVMMLNAFPVAKGI